MRRLVPTAAVAAGSCVVALAAPALAAAPDATGWWSSANRGVTVPTPPDVEEGNLLVQGLAEPGGAQSIAAVRLDLAGRTAVALALEVRDPGPTTPAMAACTADPDWQPAVNGQWAERPEHDCADPVAGVYDATTGLVLFTDIESLVVGGILSVTLVPTDATRVVLAAPDEGSVQMEAPPPMAAPAGVPPAERPSAGEGRGRQASSTGAPRSPRGMSLQSASAPAAPEEPVQEPQAPVVADEPTLPERPLRSEPVEPGSGIRRGTDVEPTGPSDVPQRRVAAMLLFAVLGPFAVRLAPGGGRLRPTEVPWGPGPT